MEGVRVLWFTDPFCPWSWAAEPQRRRLEVRFAGTLSFTYVMTGVARRFERPVEALAEWIAAAAASGMPLDPRLWLHAPPSSSYPACLGVCAAAEQGVGAAFLRRAREAITVEGRPLDNADALMALAREVPGCDADRFRVDLDSHAIVEAFGADLDRARAGVEREASRAHRAEFHAGDGAVHRVGPRAGHPDYEAAARAAGAVAVAEQAPGVEQALARFGTMATAEIAAVCDLPGPQAPAELWSLAVRWRVRARESWSGELWELA